MKLKVNKLALFLFLFLAITSFGQSKEINCKTTSTRISGIYDGKNLFFQIIIPNSIQNIIVNKNEITISKSSDTFELDLSTLKKGQTYDIIINYCEGSKTPYKLLNSNIEK